MKRTGAVSALIILLGTAASSPALAWGATGHRLIGELASQSLPIEVPAFLRNLEAARQIGEVAREPDRSKGAGQPHDADADPAHHINAGDDLKIARGPALSALPPTRESYDNALRMVGSNEYRAGFLPYAIADAWEQLVIDLAYWRADVASAKNAANAPDRTWFLRDQYLREGITIRDLGFLAHFVGDGSQPMHVSVHSDGWGNFPNPQNFTTAKGFHAKFEGAFVRARIAARDISARMSPYRDCRCTIQQRVAEYLSASGKAVTTLFSIEKAGGFDDDSEQGRLFAAERLAAGAGELRDLIADAWRRSADVSVGFPPLLVRDIESGKVNALGSLQGLD